MLAGLAADGRTVVEQIHHLDRGYQRLDHKLRQLGARIERATDHASLGHVFPPDGSITTAVP